MGFNPRSREGANGLDPAMVTTLGLFQSALP